LILLISSCGKEEFQVDQVPFRELESSFYELADSTLEITPSQLDLIRTSDENTMVLDRSFGVIQPGHIIWSSFETAREDFIGRKVIEVDVLGEEYILTTVPATILQAYSSFYIDTEKPNIIELRNEEGYNLSSFFDTAQTLFNNALNSTLSAIGSDLEADFQLAITGEISGSIKHPNAVCRQLTGCTLSGNILPSGIDAAADEYLGITQNANINIKTILGTVGYMKFNIIDFGLEKLNIKFTSSSDILSLTDLEPGLKGQTTKGLTEVLKATSSNLQKPDGKDLLYVPTPLTFGPQSTVFVTVSPLLEMVGNLSLFFGFDFTSTDKIDIEVGNVILFDELKKPSTTIPSNINDYEVRITKRNNDGVTVPADITDLFSSANISAQLGASSTITFNGGINLGVSIGAGEPTTAGLAAGIIMPMGFSFGLTGEGVADFPITPVDKTPSFYGSLCANADFGVLDIVAFTDSNFKIPGSDLFDYFLTIKDILPIDLPKTSLFDWAPDLQTNNGKLCWESTCAFLANTELQQFSVVSDFNTSMEFQILIENPQLSEDREYNVEIQVGGQTISLNSIVKKNSLEIIPFVPGSPDIENLIRAKDFSITFYIVEEAMRSCEVSFDGSRVGVFDTSCEQEFWFVNVGIGAKTGIAPNGPNSYFTRDDLLNRTFTDQGETLNILALLKTKSATISALADNPDCVSPSGYLTVETKGLVNSHESYVWYSDQSSLDGKPILGMLEVTHGFAGSIPEYEFKDIAITEGVAAVLIK